MYFIITHRKNLRRNYTNSCKKKFVNIRVFPLSRVTSYKLVLHSRNAFGQQKRSVSTGVRFAEVSLYSPS